MNEFFQNLKQEALNEKLSQHEKQSMRVALYDAMKKPYMTVQEVTVVRAVRSSYVWFSPQFALPVAVFLIVGLGSGTAFASQTALPGDALYTIKVNITEPAVGALAISDEAKAEWHAQVAQTRLEEAETLAAEGKLDAAASAELAENFDKHSNEAAALAQKAEDKEPGSGAEIAAQIDSSLEAHDAILARVGSTGSASKKFAEDVALRVRERSSVTLALVTIDHGDDPTNNAQDNSVMTMSLQAVAPQATTSATTRANIQATTTENKKIAAQTEAQVKATAKLRKSAANALSEAKTIYGTVKKSLGASTTLRIEGEITRISVVVNATSSTNASLTSALKDATVLKAFLKASKSLKLNLFSRTQFNSQKVEPKKEDAKPASSTSTTIKGDAQIQADAQSTDTNKGSGPGSEGDQKKGEDSFVNNLLNNI